MDAVESALLKLELLTTAEHTRLKEYKDQTGKSSGLAVIELGFVSEDVLLDCLSEYYRLPKIDLRKLRIEQSVVGLLTKDVCRKHLLFPFETAQGTVRLAIVDPTNIFALDEVRLITGLQVEPFVASEWMILEAIEKYYRANEPKVFQNIFIDDQEEEMPAFPTSIQPLPALPQDRTCPSCKQIAHPDHRFCSSCGASIPLKPAQTPFPVPAPIPTIPEIIVPPLKTAIPEDVAPPASHSESPVQEISNRPSSDAGSGPAPAVPPLPERIRMSEWTTRDSVSDFDQFPAMSESKVQEGLSDAMSGLIDDEFAETVMREIPKLGMPPGSEPSTQTELIAVPNAGLIRQESPSPVVSVPDPAPESPAESASPERQLLTEKQESFSRDIPIEEQAEPQAAQPELPAITIETEEAQQQAPEPLPSLLESIGVLPIFETQEPAQEPEPEPTVAPSESPALPVATEEIPQPSLEPPSSLPESIVAPSTFEAQQPEPGPTAAPPEPPALPVGTEEIPQPALAQPSSLDEQDPEQRPKAVKDVSISGEWQSMAVFVSSTFEDLVAERDHLARYVFPRLRKELLNRNIHFMDYDPRWAIAAEHQAENAESLLNCLTRINESRAFVGILGERYGRCIDPIPYELIRSHPWLAAYQGCSQTHLEMACAIGAAEKTKRFFYLRRPEFLNQVPPVSRSRFISEDSWAAAKLSQLKHMIRDAGAVREYSCNWEDPAGVNGLENFGEEIYRSLLDLAGELKPHERTQPLKEDPVDCAVFAPPSSRAGQHFMVQVFAHLKDQTAEVKTLAVEFDSSAQRRGYKTLETRVPRNTRLAFELSFPGFIVDDPVQTLAWAGLPQAVQFSVFIPDNYQKQNGIGKIIVSRDSVPVGHIKFTISVRPDASQKQDLEPTGDEARNYRMAFVSYASKDRDKVLSRVQMLQALGIKYFQDVLHLEPGDRWDKKLYMYIDHCDLFLLFWSEAAKQSDWVRREVNHALSKRAAGDSVPEIRPVILDAPPVVDPWPELQHLYMNDRLLYLLDK